MCILVRMNNVRVFENPTALADAAAEQTLHLLQSAIEKYGSATWVLAGGSTPIPAYHVIADQHSSILDWSKVTLLMGDERIGPVDNPDSNWQAIDSILGSLPTTKIVPISDQTAEKAADEYESQLASLPKFDNGLPRLDVVWLGVGADGHTMSLFPSHASILPSNNLVIAVHDSPKPPSDRISLTLRTLQGAQNVIVLATGSDKRPVISSAVKGSHTPIGLATSIVGTHEGTVTWLVDQAAAPTD